MKTLSVTWTGIRPIVMHNGLMADPTNPLTMAIKEIVRKGSKKMTVTDHQRRDELEWEAGLYWDDSFGPIIPSDNIESCIKLGAQKSRIGKDVQAAVLCSEPVIKLEYDGPRKKEQLLRDPRFTLRKGAKVQTSTVIRVRPMFPTGWKLNFDLEYDDTIVNEASLRKAMDDAGALIGLGDHRPKFGRFIVE